MEILLGHVIVGELEKMSRVNAAILYLKLGYRHILPLGFDHILFVLSFFAESPAKTGFVAGDGLHGGPFRHFRIGDVPSHFAAHPNYRAADRNLYRLRCAGKYLFPKLKPSRVAVVFLFGLVHGYFRRGAWAAGAAPKLLSAIAAAIQPGRGIRSADDHYWGVLSSGEMVRRQIL